MDSQADTQIPPRSPSIRPQDVLLDPFRPGAICPDCGEGRLDYNGLLELECPICGFRFNSGAGYT